VSTAVALTTSYSLVAWLAQRGELSAGDVAAVIAGVALAAAQVASVIAGLRRVDDEALLFLADLDDLVEEKSETLTAGSATAAIAVEPDELSVEHLGFSYPGAPRPTLHDINFNVRRGEMLAIVGDNGAGKTTLVKLLLALYQPDTGNIRLDATDIADIGIADLRSAFGALFQDFVPFEFTVTENVTTGRIDRTSDPQAVDQALRQAKADEFCNRLDDGLDTVVGRILGAGHDLSGGQWQRLALARLFYRDPHIWILDEPTAALDPEAEALVFAELRDALRDRIAIVISHRFSTVRAADRILVLDDGTISEMGTHDELVANGRRYAHLYNLQASAFR
jgi:ATP-binding cassette subfamily B protein